MDIFTLPLKKPFSVMILVLFALTACGGGGGGGGGGSSASGGDGGRSTDDGTTITFNAGDTNFGLLKDAICLAWTDGRNFKFVFDDARKGIQPNLVTADSVTFEAKQRTEFCDGTDDGGFTTADATGLFTGGNATSHLCATMRYGTNFMSLTPDTLYFLILAPSYGDYEVALTREQIEIICGGDLSTGAYEADYYNVGEMRAVNLPSDVIRTQPQFETLRQSSIHLSHLFQRGAMQDNLIQTHDEFGNAISFNPSQAQSVKASYGLSDAMHDLTFSAKRDELFSNEQANLAFTTNKHDSGQSNFNADYHLGNMFMSADYNPLMKGTKESAMQFMQISDSARDVGTLGVSHKLGDTLTFTQKAGAGTLNTGNRFDEISTALAYQKAGKKLSIGAGRLREYNQFLGSVTRGAYALDEATESAYLSLHADMSLGKNLTMQANYSRLNSAVSLHHDDFVRVNGLRSDSYDVTLQSKMKRGNLSLQYLVPLAVTNGTWQQRNVVNLQDTIAHQDLSVNERHQQWQLRYQSDAQHHIHVFATLTRDENYSNIAGLNETRVMAGVSRRF